ncbi:MAG: LysR substrate-binding domain-containing protein [Burkholderiaceae bacterium]
MARTPLQTLPTFRTIARSGNLRAAAEELHLTHSAVSQQLRLLETQIGVQLFDRRAQRIVLNAAGAALLRSVEPALDMIDDGVRSAAAAAAGAQQRMRVSVLPSFAQRWLLPRMGDWHARHPDIGIELHASQQIMDLQREGFHAALRQGNGQWRGLRAERLVHSPRVPVGSPQAAQRLLGADARKLAHEPLLGSASMWERWFALSGVKVRVNPVATFNDAALMLQAAEQNLGIALVREMLAADALRERRLVRLSTLALPEDSVDAYWLVYPENLKDWPPLKALRQWLFDQLERSRKAWAEADASPLRTAAGTAAAGPTGSRSRARSATRARGRGR